MDNNQKTFQAMRKNNILTVFLILCLLRASYGSSSSEDSSTSSGNTLLAPVAFTLHRLALSTGAACLDGSQPGVYVSQGIDPRKFVIVLEAPSICFGFNQDGALQECLGKIDSDAGSSANYPASQFFDDYTFLTNDRKVNPFFWKWSKAIIKSCDGTGFLGERADPVNVEGTNLYIRGGSTLKAALQFLNTQYGLFSKKKVVLSGTSTGGLAALVWANYLSNKLKKPQALSVIADSTIYAGDYVQPILQNAVLLSQTRPIFNYATEGYTVFPVSECFADYPGQEILCGLAGFVTKYVKPRIFFIQSLYDRYSLNYIAAVPCVPLDTKLTSLENCSAAELALIELYRLEIQADIAVIGVDTKNSVWAIGCSQHIFTHNATAPASFSSSPNYVVQYPYGITINEALKYFLRGDHIVLVDDSHYPENQGCSAIKPDHCSVFDGTYCTACDSGYRLFDGNRCILFPSRRRPRG